MLRISRTWCNPSYKLLAFVLHHLHISIFLVLLHYIGLSYAINDDDDDDELEWLKKPTAPPDRVLLEAPRSGKLVVLSCFVYTLFILMRFKPRFSAVLQIFLSADGSGRLEEGLRFEIRLQSIKLLRSLLSIFAVPCSGCIEPQRTAVYEPCKCDRVILGLLGYTELCIFRCSFVLSVTHYHPSELVSTV